METRTIDGNDKGYQNQKRAGKENTRTRRLNEKKQHPSPTKNHMSISPH